MSLPLFIAEKPDMGRKIAQNLPGPHKKGDGFIETAGGTVTWAIGHLLEQVSPDDYDVKYKKWDYADLPIVPTVWKIQVSSGKSKQVQVIKTLLKTCSEVVNAGDPGREGQLIVDELLEFLNNKKPVFRLLLNSLDPVTVKKALASLQPNSLFEPLYQAALGRQRADWLVGMNLTRAYTILGRKHGYAGVLSVGRVQTPTLAVVTRREDEIDAFVPQNFFALKCKIGSIPAFWARYLPPAGLSADPPPARPAWLDESFRINDPAKAQTIVADVKGKQATVVSYANTPAQEQAPLPFKLSGLQTKMNAQHGSGVQAVLDACQSLYEKGYASYPRTDCCYLPPTQHGDAGNILKAVQSAHTDWAGIITQADLTLISPAWNEKKLGEHHAIIPTGVAPNLAELSALERHIYDTIALRYLAQFFPVCEVDKASVELEAGGHRWGANGRVIKVPGWRLVYGASADDEGAEEKDDKKDKDEDDGKGALPALAVGDKHPVADATSTAQQTKPPPRYTEGSLIQAMEHVDRLVTDPAEKKMLKNVEGIGRAATRSNIIGTLLKRGFLEVNKKQLHPSVTARALVKTVPADLIDPGLTARWEQALDGVAAAKITLAAFQQKQEGWIRHLVLNAPLKPFPPPPPGMAAANAASAHKTTSKTPFKAKPGAAGAKTSFAPKTTGAKPAVKGASGNPGEKTCPKCQKPMRERAVKQGPKAGQTFWGCSGFPACTHSEWPK